MVNRCLCQMKNPATQTRLRMNSGLYINLGISQGSRSSMKSPDSIKRPVIGGHIEEDSLSVKFFNVEW